MCESAYLFSCLFFNLLLPAQDYGLAVALESQAMAAEGQLAHILRCTLGEGIFLHPATFLHANFRTHSTHGRRGDFCDHHQGQCASAGFCLADQLWRSLFVTTALFFAVFGPRSRRKRNRRRPMEERASRPKPTLSQPWSVSAFGGDLVVFSCCTETFCRLTRPGLD